MEALLILAGGLLLAVGWVWLVVATMRQSVSRMALALFFGPLTLLLRGMGYPLLPRLLMLIGLLAVVSGGAWLRYQHPERVDQLLAGRWLAEPAAPGMLRGAIMGQPFNPNRATWRGDDLVLEEGDDNRQHRALTIRFGSARELLQPSMAWLPDDQGAWPELVLRWHTGALAEPGLRRLSRGYSLSLDFTHTERGQVEGRLHLHLPSGYGTWLSGQFQLEAAPQWMIEAERGGRLRPQPSPPVSRLERPGPAAPAWRELSLLAVLDEPERFTGATVRLTTWAGRTHEGVVKEVSAEQRLVLSIPRGANQVELHFHPLDLRLIEERTTR